MKIRVLYFLLSFFIFSCAGKKHGFHSQNSTKSLNTKGIANVSAQDSKLQTIFIKAESFFLQKEYAKALILFDECISQKNNFSAAFYKKAQCHEQLNEASAAINAAHQAIEYENKFEPYALYMVHLYKRMYNYQAAIFTYNNLIDATGETKYWKEIGFLHEKLIQNENNINNDSQLEKTKKINLLYQQMLQAFNNYEKHNTIDPSVIEKKQEILLIMGEKAEAFKEGERIVQLYPNDLNCQFRQAQLLYNWQGKNSAIDYVNNMIEKNPSSASCRLALADIHKKSNDFDQYKKELSKAFDLPGIDLNEKVKLINLMIIGNIPQSLEIALELAEKITKVHPKAPQAFSIYAETLQKSKKSALAAANYRTALKLDPSQLLIWKELLSIDKDLLDTVSLISDAKTALNIHTHEYNIAIDLALALASNKKHTEAINLLEKQLEISRRDSGASFNLNYHLAELYISQNQLPKGIAIYEKLLEAEPNNPYIINNYAYRLAEIDSDLDKAESMMSRVVRVFDSNPNFLDTYGWILHKKGLHQEGLEYLKKSLTINESLDVLEHTGDIYTALGNKPLALEYYRKAQSKGQKGKINDKIKNLE